MCGTANLILSKDLILTIAEGVFLTTSSTTAQLRASDDLDTVKPKWKDIVSTASGENDSRSYGEQNVTEKNVGHFLSTFHERKTLDIMSSRIIYILNTIW